MTKDVLHRYQPLRRVGEGLFVVDGWWESSPMGRRMTVLEVGGGKLVIHSAIRMSEADMRQLDERGEVAYVIAPNPFHASEVPWYAERYPTAQVLVPRRMRERQQRRMRIDGTVEDDWPAALAGELEVAPIEGLRFPEPAYRHVRSRTLVVTDLVMNFGADQFRGFTAWLMRWNGVVDRFGPSRLLRWGMIRDRSKLRESMRGVLQRDFDRVVMSHGWILETDGKARMSEAFAFLGV